MMMMMMMMVTVRRPIRGWIGITNGRDAKACRQIKGDITSPWRESASGRGARLVY